MNFKSTLLVLCIFFAGGMVAQDSASSNENSNVVGPWTIGGNFNFTTGNVNNYFLISNVENFNAVDKSTRFGIYPALAYGFNNYWSATVFLGYNFIRQEGTSFLFLSPSPFFNTRDLEGREHQYSFGASVDRYVILKKFFGFRMEIGGSYTIIKNTINFDAVNLGGFFFPNEEYKTTANSMGIFLSPNIDFFIGQRINIVATLGNIGYFRNAFNDPAVNGHSVFWLFQTNISPDNVGLGIEFNF